MRVEQYLAHSARRFPSKTALVAGGDRVSYEQLDDDSNRLAHRLRECGIEGGDRVALFLDNSVEAVIGLFATLRAGGVFCLVNPSTKADKLSAILSKYGAKALITQERLADVAREALHKASCTSLKIMAGARESAGDWHSYEQILRDSPCHALSQEGLDIDLAMIVTTSGSTGLPKGVMMTHQNIETAAGSIIQYLESVPQDVVLSVLPLAFDYGLYQVLMSVKVGASLVLERSFTYPALVLNMLRQERVTGFPIVPSIGALLLQMKTLEPGSFDHVRYITSTAAALPPSHIRALQALFPGARLYSMYGLTECKRCTYLPPEQLARRPDSVGIAIPGTQAYVVDEQGRRAAPGMIGELVIRGGHVFKGYWGDPEETERMLRPGPYPWEKVLYTGDLFRSDEDGYLYFVARKDDIIKTAGEKVSPKEVESVIYALPGVREAAVVGVPHPILGSAIKAFVVAEPDAGLSERKVIRHCAAHLESFMVPASVEFRAELPHTLTGKIRRGSLRSEALRIDGEAETERYRREPPMRVEEV